VKLMHEVSIIQNVIEIVTQKAIDNNLTNIRKVTLKIGELTDIMPESLSFAFESCRIGTLLEGATLEIQNVSALGQCQDCNLEFPIDHFNKLCPNCHKFCSSIISGYELYVNTIEGD
jgi:hydrogenase nickel incorporation protein HypA/HybF